MKVMLLGGNTKEEIEKRLKMVSAAGYLSRANGTVSEVYESRSDYNNNLKLAKYVTGLGHKSIAEHDYLVFAIEDVTPIIEQTLIGYRLTSFTIKSRRNVDFRNVGFYVPDFKDNDGNILMNNLKLQKTYISYMQSLFDKYGYLVDNALPIEDARYILPYSYHSNIIMGCDANELLRMVGDLLYGKISKVTEAYELGLELKKILDSSVPYLSSSLNNESNKDYYGDKYLFLDEVIYKYFSSDRKLLDKVNMTNYTSDPDFNILCSILISRYEYSYEKACQVLKDFISVEPGIEKKLMRSLIESKNQRELEQVNFSFEIPISLAALTHITRHRMQSLLVPEFTNLSDLMSFVIPPSIKDFNEEWYTDVFKENKLMMEYFCEEGVRKEDLIYFYLSGNALNIYTSMNGRTLEWISRMRCCNKAQWEIRNIVNQMVAEVKKVAPLMGEGLGSYCNVFGYCPEGKDSCKNRGVVRKLENKNNIG